MSGGTAEAEGDEAVQIIADNQQTEVGFLSEQQLEQFALALSKNTRLTKLAWNNNIGDEKVKIMANLLTINTSLSTLDLSGNGIGFCGIQLLAKALQINSSLTTLNISSNKIGDEGVKAIAEALNTNKSLTSLDLSDNGIGLDGSRCFADTLRFNKSLKAVNIKSDGATALAMARTFNKSLKNLYMDADLFCMGNDIFCSFISYKLELFRCPDNATWAEVKDAFFLELSERLNKFRISKESFTFIYNEEGDFVKRNEWNNLIPFRYGTLVVPLKAATYSKFDDSYATPISKTSLKTPVASRSILDGLAAWVSSNPPAPPADKSVELVSGFHWYKTPTGKRYHRRQGCNGATEYHYDLPPFNLQPCRICSS